VHVEIANLFVSLNRVIRGGPTTKGELEADPRTNEIYKKLEQPTTMEFFETPLGDVVEYLKDFHDVAIQIDEASLDDVGASPDTPITLNLSKVSLRSALYHLLSPLDLTVVVENQVIVVTSTDIASESLPTRVYGVQDLTANGDYESLIDAIVSSVESFSWSCVGGPGDIEPFRGTLVISQRDEVHREIEDLLAQLRYVNQNSPRDANPNHVQRPVLMGPMARRIYAVRGMSPMSLAKTLCASIEPATWSDFTTKDETSPDHDSFHEADQAAGRRPRLLVIDAARPTATPVEITQSRSGEIKSSDDKEEAKAAPRNTITVHSESEAAISGWLVVWHNAKVHRQIDKLLADIEAASESSKGSKQGGGGFGGGQF
jgi:hypothetical protein